VAAVFILVFFQSFSEVYLPNLMSDIVDTGIVNGDTPYILRMGGRMLLIAVAGTVCAVLGSFLSSRTATGFGTILRQEVFSKAEGFSLQEFDRFGAASLITRTTNDIAQMQHVCRIMLRMMLRAPMICIGGIVMAVSTDAKLSLVIIVVMPILAAFIYLVGRMGLPLFRAIQEKLDRMNLVLREALTGIRVVRAFNRVDYEKERFNQANLNFTEAAVRAGKLMAALMPFMMLVLNFTIIVIIWFGALRIDGGYMHVGDLMAFIQYIMLIMSSLIMLSILFVMVPRAAVSAGRINELLDLSSAASPAHGSSGAESNGSAEQTGRSAGRLQGRGRLEFKDVTFSYPGAEKSVLSNISFCALPGEMTAVIGGIGSGKTTLINLIPRFFDIDSGSISVDGVDIRDMTQQALRAMIGYVPQKAVLFSGSVAENIRYGKEDASDDEVRRVLEAAQAAEFINGMPQGLDSVITQGGSNLSGGQKQRLAIARALVRRPLLYVLDDCFSALDYKTDSRLRASLRKETAGSTLLIVAQRVSTVMGADQIVVLDEGRIAGIGRHEELLDSCSVYREIVSSQLSLEELA
jgi:ATP-binding cassette subfamily B protein